MNTWEKFVSEELKTSTEKAMFICKHYNTGGSQGTACTKQCPFRVFGGWCKLYDINGNLRPEDEIDKIINEEIKNVFFRSYCLLYRAALSYNNY